jgi:hypothetical protein
VSVVTLHPARCHQSCYIPSIGYGGGFVLLRSWPRRRAFLPHIPMEGPVQVTWSLKDDGVAYSGGPVWEQRVIHLPMRTGRVSGRGDLESGLGDPPDLCYFPVRVL